MKLSVLMPLLWLPICPSTMAMAYSLEERQLGACGGTGLCLTPNAENSKTQKVVMTLYNNYLGSMMLGLDVELKKLSSQCARPSDQSPIVRAIKIQEDAIRALDDHYTQIKYPKDANGNVGKELGCLSSCDGNTNSDWIVDLTVKVVGVMQRWIDAKELIRSYGYTQPVLKSLSDLQEANERFRSLIYNKTPPLVSISCFMHHLFKSLTSEFSCWHFGIRTKGRRSMLSLQLSKHLYNRVEFSSVW
jgi:hypothetical protein